MSPLEDFGLCVFCEMDGSGTHDEYGRPAHRLCADLGADQRAYDLKKDAELFADDEAMAIGDTYL